MLIIGIIAMVLGAALFWLGWALNMQTPVQQPLPVVGLAVGFVGLVLTLLAL